MLEIKNTKVHTSISRALSKLDALTKRLKVMKESKRSDRVKIVISSKDLCVSSLGEGTRMVIEPHPEKQALYARPANVGDAKTRVVSKRTYKNRQGVEPVIDIRHQQNIKATIGDAEYVHVTFQKDGVWIKPATTYAQIASKSPSGATITITQPDEEGLYSQILKALKVIKASYFTTIKVNISKEFKASHEYVLLSVQLRRLGFTLTTQNNLLLAHLPRTPMLDELSAICLDTVSYADNPGTIHHRFNFDVPLSTFVACSAGVDISVMEKEGYRPKAVLEYRPAERRDYKKSVCKTTGDELVKHHDKTATGAECAALNSQHAKVIFNEDIYHFDMQLAGHLMPAFNVLHIAVQCDEFSLVKSKSLKQKSIESLDTTTDMFIPALELINATNAPVVILENVPGFASSIEGRLFKKALQWLGHDVDIEILDAQDFNGMTRRKRCYLLGTQLGLDCSPTRPLPRTTHAWNDVIAPRLSELRDVSHCKSIQKGIDTGRIRLIKEGDAVAPTILKSQLRQVKDSVYVYLNGRYYLPSNDMCKALMGIPDDFDLAPFSQDIAGEVIGQSIEVPLHRSVCNKVKAHIERYVNAFSGLKALFTGDNPLAA